MNDTTIETAPRFRNALWLRHTLPIHAPRASVFDFLVRDVPKHYRSLATGHERFEVEGGGPIEIGAVIDCREHAENQRVHHRYVVRALRPGAHLHYASTPSRSWVTVAGREHEGQSDTHVYYDISDSPDGGTHLDMAIVIVFQSWFLKTLALFGGTRKLWQAHQHEELEKLAAILERRESRRADPAAGQARSTDQNV